MNQQKLTNTQTFNLETDSTCLSILFDGIAMIGRELREKHPGAAERLARIAKEGTELAADVASAAGRPWRASVQRSQAGG